MEAVSHDQYKVQYLLQRIAEITREHEEEMATGSLQLKILSQERDVLQGEVNSLKAQVEKLESQLDQANNELEEHIQSR